MASRSDWIPSGGAITGITLRTAPRGYQSGTTNGQPAPPNHLNKRTATIDQSSSTVQVEDHRGNGENGLSALDSPVKLRRISFPWSFRFWSSARVAAEHVSNSEQAQALRNELNPGHFGTMQGSAGTSPAKKGLPKQQRPPSINIPPTGRWQPLSPTTADRLLGNSTGHDDCLSPGGSPKYSSRKRPDSRRAILMGMTFSNLLLALVLLILGFAGPDYPGHSGTVDKSYFHTAGHSRRLRVQDSPLYEADCPTYEMDTANASILHSALAVGLVIWLTQPCSMRLISRKVDRWGAAATLLTSVVCALTCLGALTIVMIDLNYVAGCCTLMQENCEVSNLCTEFVDTCCISDDVGSYCGNSSFHIGAVSMIFLVFMSTSAMLVMSGTMACRCWLDSDPDRQALMMVLAGTPTMGSPMASGRATPLSSTSPRFVSPSAVRKPHQSSGAVSPLPRFWRPSDERQRKGSTGDRSHQQGDGEGRYTSGESQPQRERCPQCGAIFGDLATLSNHVERFHTKVGGRAIVIDGTGESVLHKDRGIFDPEVPAGVSSVTKNGSTITPVDSRPA